MASVTSATASVLLECGTLGAASLPAGCLANERAAESAESPGVEKDRARRDAVIAERRECEQQRETTTSAAGRAPRSPASIMLQDCAHHLTPQPGITSSGPTHRTRSAVLLCQTTALVARWAASRRTQHTPTTHAPAAVCSGQLRVY